MMEQTLSNQFQWSTYEVPRVSSTASNRRSIDGEDKKTEDDMEQQQQEEEETFLIRHLKQGRTGAVKTWPAAELLLEYLTLQGGLSNESRVNENASSETFPGVLDLTLPNLAPQEFPSNKNKNDEKPWNVVELGGGTGYLSVGLALSLNRKSCTSSNHNHPSNGSGGRFQPRVRLLCTDMDKGTIKNMRYNVTQQARDRNVTKAVRVETLDWGEDLGGEKFLKAVESHFGGRSKPQQQSTSSSVQELDDANSDQERKDPIRLVTHLIGSDVHYGETTLEPLSDVVSGFKVRNPNVAVILAIKERSPNAMEDLKQAIEQKVRCAARADSDLVDLEDFSVNVRNVIHNYGDNLSNLKMIEC